MNIQLPYDNNELNVHYLLAKNQEANTTSSLIILCFFCLGCLLYSISNTLLKTYKKKFIDAKYIILLLNKIHKLDLE